MKSILVCAAFLIAIASAAIAQSGGYPASPSHAVTGTNPDGTPRYGSESGKDANQPRAVERTGPDPSGDHGGADGSADAGKDNPK